MPSDLEITQAAHASLQQHAIQHIRKSHRSAREAHDADKYVDLKTFGMAAWEGLYRRFLDDLIPRPDTPFEALEVSSGYVVPVIDHDEYGLIAIHHHRVDEPEYCPKNGSAKALRDHVSDQKDLFKAESRPVRPRLLGIVGDPYNRIQKAIVGKLVPVWPGSNHYRLAHNLELDLDSSSGSTGDGGGGDNKVGPEPSVGPEVTLENQKSEESTSAQMAQA